MTAKGTVRPGVRRAYGYTWYCPGCDTEMQDPPIGASFDEDAMALRRGLAIADWDAHVEGCLEQPGKLAVLEYCVVTASPTQQPTTINQQPGEGE